VVWPQGSGLYGLRWRSRRGRVQDFAQHIANGSYIVDAKVRGKGLGRIMVEHSLREAKRSGFMAIQFNCVVSSNVHAVHLYHTLGFVTLATVPKGFNHATLGLIDSYVMYRALDDIEL
jgi:ribosomal protein S18 acetylase RimI-like enzyme